jgi:hypothetical protein
MALLTGLLRRRIRFSPASVAAGYLDLNAATLAGADNDPISAIPDSFGLSHALTTTAPSATAPTLKLALQNGRNVVRFNGTTDKLYGTFGVALAQPFTVLLALAPKSAAMGQFFDSTNRALLGMSAVPVYQQYAGSTILTGGTPDTNWHVYSCKFAGASSRVRLDGVSIITGNPGTVSLGDLFLGGDINPGGVKQMDFGRMLGYSGLSDANELLLEAYLKAEWGVL